MGIFKWSKRINWDLGEQWLNKILMNNFRLALWMLLPNAFFLHWDGNGYGKTYVYTKTVFGLHKRYGFTKFVVVVPIFPDPYVGDWFSLKGNCRKMQRIVMQQLRRVKDDQGDIVRRTVLFVALYLIGVPKGCYFICALAFLFTCRLWRWSFKRTSSQANCFSALCLRSYSLFWLR